MTEEPDQTPQDQQDQDSDDDGPVVDGRESANEVAKELKEEEEQIEDGAQEETESPT